jgi:hypothetical protein
MARNFSEIYQKIKAAVANTLAVIHPLLYTSIPAKFMHFHQKRCVNFQLKVKLVTRSNFGTDFSVLGYCRVQWA